jgi:hypothetical protein
MENRTTALQHKALEGLYLNTKYLRPAGMFSQPATFILHSWIKLLWSLSKKKTFAFFEVLLFVFLYPLVTEMM